MNLFQVVIAVTLLGNTALGGIVLLANPRRRANQAFFGLTLLIMAWLGCMLAATLQTHGAGLLYFVRQTSAQAATIPLGVLALHHAILDPAAGWGRVLVRMRGWLAAGMTIVAIAHAPVFITAATPADAAHSVPVSSYGWGLLPYLGYFAVVMLALLRSFRRTARATSGAVRAEIQYVQLGCALSLGVGVGLYGAAILGGRQETSRFVPLAVLILDALVAYGIATRRILAAPTVLQRVVAYGLMAVYLATLYFLVHAGGRWLFRPLAPHTDYLAHLLAALALAFSLLPAHGWMQAAARRLIAAESYLNVSRALAKAGHVFREVATEAELTANFTRLLGEVFDAETARVLRRRGHGGFAPVTDETGADAAGGGAPDDPIADLLADARAPVAIESLERMRATPASEAARARYQERGIALAAGGFLHGAMNVMVWLERKRSGRIYDAREQRALQLLCDQFAVALGNAALYTVVRNDKIYNDILLDALTSGVVAVDANRRITVFNRCAQSLTGLSETAVVGRAPDALPPPLAAAVTEVLTARTGFRDRDLSLPRTAETELPIRVSGAPFANHHGKPMGALLVFTDLSQLKRMEEQVRRTDRLSSLGTLSAGMAHEIKNPLVTIKTFAHLLPSHYDDPEFRRTFSELVGQEVGRIDAIVNRLLHFARPAPPVLREVSLHAILDNALSLAAPQLTRAAIVVRRAMTAPRDRINADAGQINQAIVNLLLNAIQAMEGGGELTVRTVVAPPAAPAGAGADAREWIQVVVADTGTGIMPEHLGRIFDPFFTTKELGSGLGLAVTHGIIVEHGGAIEVESQPGAGSAFRLTFPLAATGSATT